MLKFNNNKYAKSHKKHRYILCLHTLIIDHYENTPIHIYIDYFTTKKMKIFR